MREREEIRTFEEPVHGLPDAMYYLFTDARGLDRVLCLEFRTTCNRRIGAAERSPLRVNIVGVRQTRAFLFCYLFSLISNPAPGASLYFDCFFFLSGCIRIVQGIWVAERVQLSFISLMHVQYNVKIVCCWCV